MSRSAILLLLWRRFTLRHWRESPGQTGLLVLILALGVAVYFSIRLANRAATASFQHFTDLVSAESDWLIQARAGDLPESVLGELRSRLGPSPVHIVPVVESTATEPPRAGAETIGSRATYRLLGIDLIGIQNIGREDAAATGAAGARSPGWFAGNEEETPTAEGEREAGGAVPSAGPSDGRVWQILRDPQSVFLSAALARRQDLRPGSVLPLVINERIVPLTVVGVIPPRTGQPEAPASLLVMDLPALQRATGRTGWLSRVEFRVAAGPEVEMRRAALRSQLEEWSRLAPPGAPDSPVGQPTAGEDAAATGRWQVLAPSDRRATGAVMTRAFRLNLTILSLLALLVGLYLVVQALDGAVVRRRAEIGILRSLGVDTASLRDAWLLEAAALGTLGGVLGAALGWAGAQLSVQLVGRTVNALYYATSAESAALTVGELAGALGLAIGASLLAGWWPARTAATTPPAQLLTRHAAAAPAAWALQHPGLGLGLVALGWICAQLPPLRFAGGIRFPAGGYAAALCWIVGAGILGGRILAITARVVRPLGRHAVAWRLAASQLTTPSGRHVLATAGLICAVAMTAGMIILVGSFDRTMRGWIERTFQADLYVSSAGAQSASTDNRLSPATWQALATDPAVAEANVLQACEATLPGGTTVLAAGDFGFMQRHLQLAWVQPPRDAGDFWTRAGDPAGEGPTPALASESFSERFRLGRGDVLSLPTPSGPQTLRLEGVFADYGNERGSLLVDRRHFTRWFQTDLAASVIVKLRNPAQAEELRARWLSAHPGLQVFTNHYLRTEILRIFRQTFAITYALEVIGLAVAVLGLALTLASVLIERRADWTTLRSLGLRPGELAGMAAIEGLIVAGVGLGVGLAASAALGWLLIRVINKQTFGWTLEFAAPLVPLALLAMLVLTGATLVSYAVGRWGAHLPADREE